MLVIIVLSVMLAVGAFMSRPSEQSFRSFVKRFEGPLLVGHDDWTYQDCLLWATIRRDGRVVYAGVFSRWTSVPQVTRAEEP